MQPTTEQKILETLEKIERRLAGNVRPTDMTQAEFNRALLLKMTQTPFEEVLRFEAEQAGMTIEQYIENSLKRKRSSPVALAEVVAKFKQK